MWRLESTPDHYSSWAIIYRPWSTDRLQVVDQLPKVNHGPLVHRSDRPRSSENGQFIRHKAVKVRHQWPSKIERGWLWSTVVDQDQLCNPKSNPNPKPTVHVTQTKPKPKPKIDRGWQALITDPNPTCNPNLNPTCNSSVVDHDWT